MVGLLLLWTTAGTSAVIQSKLLGAVRVDAQELFVRTERACDVCNATVLCSNAQRQDVVLTRDLVRRVVD